MGLYQPADIGKPSLQLLPDLWLQCGNHLNLRGPIPIRAATLIHEGHPAVPYPPR